MLFGCCGLILWIKTSKQYQSFDLTQEQIDLRINWNFKLQQKSSICIPDPSASTAAVIRTAGQGHEWYLSKYHPEYLSPLI